MRAAPSPRAEDPRPPLGPGEAPRENFRNILIVRLSSIGDIVFALPALEVLRAWFPKARISWIAEDRAAGLLEGHPLLDEVIVVPRKAWRRMRSAPDGLLPSILAMGRFFRDLRRRRFDLAIDFQGNLKSGLVSFLSRAPVRLGLGKAECKEPNWLFSTRRLEAPDRVMHRVERDLRLLTLIDLPLEFRWPVLAFSEDDMRPVDRYFAELAAAPRPFVLLHPGTSAWGPHKRWPLESYARLGDALIERRGATVFVNHGPGEEDLAEGIMERMRHPVRLAPPMPDMRQVAYFLRHFDLVVGSDTGPTHLAAMQRVDVVTLFGPYDPRLYYPYHHPERALFAGLPCSPCRYRTCGTLDCMHHIRPEIVLASCEAILDDRPMVEGRLTPHKTVRV